MKGAEATTVSLRRAPLSAIRERIEGVGGMHVSQSEVGHVRKFLWPDEIVELTIKQRTFRPGGSLATPTSFIATNHRLIILNRTMMGMRKNYEVIPYRYITAVKLEHGLFSCSVFIRVSAVDKGDGNGQQEAIGGIRVKEAETLVHYLNKKIHHASSDQSSQKSSAPSDAETKFCVECGTKNPVLAKFCAACGVQLLQKVAVD